MMRRLKTVVKSTDANVAEHEQDADGETHIADASDDECFFPGVRRRFFQEPEADQQVAAQARRLPIPQTSRSGSQPAPASA